MCLMLPETVSGRGQTIAFAFKLPDSRVVPQIRGDGATAMAERDPTEMLALDTVGDAGEASTRDRPAPSLRDVLARDRFLPFEDEAPYRRLESGIFDHVRPGDVFDEIRADLLVGAAWNAKRDAQLQTSVFRMQMIEFLAKELHEQAGGYSKPSAKLRTLAAECADGDPEAVAAVREKLGPVFDDFLAVGGLALLADDAAHAELGLSRHRHEKQAEKLMRDLEAKADPRRSGKAAGVPASKARVALPSPSPRPDRAASGQAGRGETPSGKNQKDQDQNRKQNDSRNEKEGRAERPLHLPPQR